MGEVASIEETRHWTLETFVVGDRGRQEGSQSLQRPEAMLKRSPGWRLRNVGSR